MELCHNCRCPDRDPKREAPEYKLSVKPCSMWQVQATRRTHKYTHTHTHTRARVLYSMLFCDMSGVYIMCYCAGL
jgi:hypothetical protein